MELDGDYITQTYSTIGGGIRHEYHLTAAGETYVSLPADYDSEGEPRTFYVQHPFLVVQNPLSNNGPFFGVEKAYNETTGQDVLNYITIIADDKIFFDPTKVSSGDIVHIILYTNYASMSNKEPARREWIEQFYRHASQLDRMDWGSYSPPFEWSKDQSGQSNLTWAYHQRLFYSFGGWNQEDTRFNSSITAGGPITRKKRTILSWSPNSPSSVGMFVGDPALNEIASMNEKFTIQPIPFYITDMTFFCRMKNGEYSTTEGAAVDLDVTIDGVPESMAVSPGYEDSDGVREIQAKFGNENSLQLSFSTALDYGKLSPAYKYGRQIESTDYNIVHKRIRTRGISLKVDARVVGEDVSWTEIDEWYLTFAGFITSGGNY